MGDDTANDATRARRRVILVIVRERQSERWEEPVLVVEVWSCVALDTKSLKIKKEAVEITE